MGPPRSGSAGPPFIYRRYLQTRGISTGGPVWQHWPVARVTRQTSKAMTRERLLGEAQRLFRERGYAATSLEQIAEAASVTKGAIYGHFSSKEDLLISAIEAAPVPAWATGMNDQSLPLRERLAEFSRAMAVDEAFRDQAVLAMELEFLAALLRSPDALRRYSAVLEGRLAELGAADHDQPLPGTAPVEVLGHRPRPAHRTADLPEHRAGHPHPGGVRAGLRAARGPVSGGLSFPLAWLRAGISRVLSSWPPRAAGHRLRRPPPRCAGPGATATSCSAGRAPRWRAPSGCGPGRCRSARRARWPRRAA